jgi:arylsulfatase A-like enzyme
MRETIFANQKRLGIMPENAKLTAWPKELPEWDALSWDKKKLFIRQADVYAAYLAYTDHQIGRVIQAVEDLGELNNTLIIYISGDNGASAEGMLTVTARPMSSPPSMAFRCPSRTSSFGTRSGARYGPSRTSPRLGHGRSIHHSNG